MLNKELFKSENSIADQYIKKYDYPYEVLPHIKEIILLIGKNLGDDYSLMKENVWISNTVSIPSNATINGPCIIDHDVELRSGCFIRGNVIVGKKCVIGNSTEIKNSILYDQVEVPHFNYVGDSILGYKSHLGAGSIISNLKSDKTNISIGSFKTNLRKIGAFLGDFVEIGCNSVLCPGSIIGCNTTVYPLVRIRGVIGSLKIVKDENNIVDKQVAKV